MELGSQIIRKAIEADKEKLNELLSKYPKKLLLVVVGGSTLPFGRLPKGFLKFELENFLDMKKPLLQTNIPEQERILKIM
jgi:hypothetical protein